MQAAAERFRSSARGSVAGLGTDGRQQGTSEPTDGTQPGCGRRLPVAPKADSVSFILSSK